MRRAALLSLFSIIGLGLVLGACGGSDNKKNASDNTPGSTEPARPTSEQTAAPTSSQSGLGGDINVTLSGALSGAWSRGDSGVSANCSIYSGQLSANISGAVGGVSYGLIVAQQTYTPGAYFLPEGGLDPARNPSAQISTSSDASKQWDLATGKGNGSIALAGGTAEAPLFITIDGDLADKNGGDPVHVTADVTCDVTIS
jgi:hypothetical protein